MADEAAQHEATEKDVNVGDAPAPRTSKHDVASQKDSKVHLEPEIKDSKGDVKTAQRTKYDNAEAARGSKELLEPEIKDSNVEVITGEEPGAEEELGEEVENEEPEEPPPISYIEMLDVPRILEDPIALTMAHLKEISDELGLIKLCWPDISSVTFENRTNFPNSYLTNNNKEKLVLLYAENFRRQYIHKFPDRKPLFLASDNECGMQKMVCSTIRPTTLPYPEIEDWESCAKFVANHFKYEILEIPVLIPNRLYSPHTSFLRQSGHSFELATSICSLLCGLGYDAFVVSGYAIDDVTLRIMKRIDSPYEPFKEVEEVVEEVVIDQKYKIQPPPPLESKFLKMMEQREVDKKKVEEERLAEIERQQILEEEKRPIDELEGQRVHAWILLLAGKRGVEQNLFIEPSTGLYYTTESDFYTGIESVWNHQNYWVNLQDCSSGLGNLDYDLTNTENWEHLLVGEPLKWRKEKPRDLGEDEELAHMTAMYDEKHLDMPLSWSLKISIPHEVIKRRFPDGFRVTQYKRTHVEEYADYVCDDGLIVKVSRFKDFDCTILETVEEEFSNRHDKLFRRITDVSTNLVTEYFNRGREDSAKKHTYYLKNSDSVTAERTIYYNYNARFDGLSKLEYKNDVLTEHYVDREDRMYYRQVVYARQKVGFPTEPTEQDRRPIMKILQKFSRNEEIPADDDIATREFNILGREINLKYHYGKGSVTASTRNFIKPPTEEMGEDLMFKPELTSGYQAKIGAKPPRHLQLFILLEQQLAEEEETIASIREAEKMIAEFLLLRAHEMAFNKLDVSLFNLEQNTDYKMAMLHQEELERIQKEKEVEKEIDYLAPYLARKGNPKKLSVQQAAEVKYQCLNEYKQLLVKRANDVQRQFDITCEKVQNKQTWYTIHHEDLTPEEEAQYFKEVNNMIFYQKTLEIRLERQKQLSHVRYRNMVMYVDNHPALQIIRPHHHTKLVVAPA